MLWPRVTVDADALSEIVVLIAPLVVEVELVLTEL